MRNAEDAELERRLRARLAVERELCEYDVGRWIPRAIPGYRNPEHARSLLSVFNRAMRGETVRACVSMPPRHGKTDSILAGLAHRLLYRPWSRAAYISYSDDFAGNQSRGVRAIAERMGVMRGARKAPLAGLADTIKFWQTEQGGSLLATGIGGELIGHGFDLGVLDDPYSGPDDARSPTIREHIWEYFNGSFFQRKEPGGSILVNHTRWDEDDIIGRLTDPDHPVEWEYYNVPVIALEHDPLGRAPGEALWPERFPLPELELIRLQVGEYAWWAQYMGRPRPRGSKVFDEPTRYSGLPDAFHGWKVCIGVDPAGTAKTSADETAIVVLAFRRDKETKLLHGMVLRGYSVRAEVPDIVELLKAIQKKWQGAPIVIETQGGHGAAVAQTLRRLERSLRIVEITTTADKFTRAQVPAAAWNQGRAQVPTVPVELDTPEIEKLLRQFDAWDSGEWVSKLVKMIRRFTGNDAKGDDYADAFSHAWNYADIHGGGESPAPEGLKTRTVVRGEGY